MLDKSSAGLTAGPSTELELVNYGAGWAWLRPEPHPVRVVQEAAAPLSPDDRVALTDLGRRASAVEALLGPWRNAAGHRTWTDPYQKPATLCGRLWACGEPVHHHNCCACERHCPLGDTAQQHETADPSDGWTVAHCHCTACVARRAEASA